MAPASPKKAGANFLRAATMWTRTKILRFSVMMGLRKGLQLIRGARRTFSEEEQQKIARVIVEDLEKNNWKIELGPPVDGHGSALMGPKKCETLGQYEPAQDK
jgi:hypothetical protein